ncbi:FAD-dependent oxidoreductase [Streptomyces sp. NPDC048442]|uniref:FAD-dependent oxidoreductase n=1 Tax=Streptomyces sp. NPDC048442 TaxID=3154823 RepID=UPI00343333B4
MTRRTGPDVLVAGAGPVGLTVAHELARRGLSVRVVDAAEGPAHTSRAVAAHPRTLELYDQMGVVEAMLNRGRRNRAFTMYARGGRPARLEADYATMPTSYPFTLLIEQTETEAVLRAALSRRGIEVEWGVRLTGLSQDADTVRATLSGPDAAEERAGGPAEERIEVPWLVGCDGGHSTVRAQLGLELAGETSETWMLSDAPIETDLPPDTIYWAHTGSQALMMVPFLRDGHWRVLDTVPAPREGDPRRAEELLSEKLSAGLGHRVEVGPSRWTSVFTFQQRMVERMHEGRVLVAGDAAHVHSPASGQGMNTGIQEACNLAWKLAMVAHGHAHRDLLATYSEERVPLGRTLLHSTRTATFLVQLKQAFASRALPLVLTAVRTVRPLRRAVQRKVLGGMSGLRIGYATSSLTTGAPGTSAGPAPGERLTRARVHDPGDPGCAALHAELRDPRWTLLLAAGGRQPDDAPADVAGTAALQYAPWLSVRTVGGTGTDGPAPLTDRGGRLRTELGLTPGGWLLVRPDGHVAARGATLTRAALSAALAPVGTLTPLADRVPETPAVVPA